MDENPGLTEQYRMASPWPLFVALGLPIAELGLLLGYASLTVGGVILFGGSIAGLVRDSGYVETAWRALAIVAVLSVVLGGVLVYADSLIDVSVAARGYAAIGAGLIMLLASLAGEVFVPDGDVAT